MSERGSGTTATDDGGLRPLSPPRSLAEDAADRIREQILAGGFEQGEHLVEARIAQQLNVSRGPVREAFKLLRAEGLLEEELRRGTFVVSITEADVREIYGLRAAIEGRAAKLLAKRGDEVSIRRLRALSDAIERAAAANDSRAISQADLDFHQVVCELSGNERLLEVFQRYVPMLRSLLQLDERVQPSTDAISQQHGPLVDAVEAGDDAKATALFEAHSEEAGELIAAYIAKLPERS
ncbi:MAG: GntR family transcriptional regulator [Actinomycetota bacterium]